MSLHKGHAHVWRQTDRLTVGKRGLEGSVGSAFLLHHKPIRDMQTKQTQAGEMCLTSFEHFLPHRHHITPPPTFLFLPLRRPRQLLQLFDIQDAPFARRTTLIYAWWYPEAEWGFPWALCLSGVPTPPKSRRKDRNSPLSVFLSHWRGCRAVAPYRLLLNF